MKLTADYLYIAFDLFPSQKGAATHINHCLIALELTFDTGILICLGNDDMPAVQFDAQRNLYVYRFKEKIVNFLERTTAFQKFVTSVLQLQISEALKLIHFRDVWGGIPAIQTSKVIKKVFEVNSFASIELPSRYPFIAKNTLLKIEELEKQCLHNVDAIITPSAVTASYLDQYYNISAEKITTISNGVSVYKPEKLKPISTQYILYFGALQKWQGIKILFKACKELLDLDIKLLVCTSITQKRVLPYQELAAQVGVDAMVHWEYELSKEQLAHKIENAICTIAPLTACDRNIVQGCNPLKILESMAYGIPVIASKLAVCSSIITDNDNGILVPPDRPEILGRAIRKAISQPERLQEMGTRAKNLITESYLWEYQEKKMQTLYTQLLQ